MTDAWDDPWGDSATADAPESAAAFTWAPLSRRIAGLGPDDTVHDGVPSYMRGALTDWVDMVYNVAENDRDSGALDNTLRLRLRWEQVPAPCTLTDEQLLDLIDAILNWWTMRPALREQIAEMLTAGGAGWRVTADGTAVERRVDETVTATVIHTVSSVTADAADHLAAAWRAAYGRHPDPDKVFHEAIRAVESIACPLVEAKKAENGKATLGTVIGELAKNSGHRWELVLPGPTGAPRDVTPLVSMLELLWQAQVSRHGGAPKSRRQDQAEAEAAVHLAATLVQWLGSGVLRKKA
ncbi:hypothetical protein ACQPYA_02240 [Micromonospora sp. CA-263727]|uniref:hypothetical protein n=1 Tax=Micromonospora sp. CA-263727 TaxID=3239967 RepID=UPI003D8F3E7E